MRANSKISDGDSPHWVQRVKVVVTGELSWAQFQTVSMRSNRPNVAVDLVTSLFAVISYTVFRVVT